MLYRKLLQSDHSLRGYGRKFEKERGRPRYPTVFFLTEPVLEDIPNLHQPMMALYIHDDGARW